MGWVTKKIGFDSHQCQKHLSSSKRLDRLRYSLSPTPLGQRTLPLALHRPGREFEHSQQDSAEVKNSPSYTFTYAFHVTI
jgi:hypothetical protein